MRKTINSCTRQFKMNCVNHITHMCYGHSILKAIVNSLTSIVLLSFLVLMIFEADN